MTASERRRLLRVEAAVRREDWGTALPELAALLRKPKPKPSAPPGPSIRERREARKATKRERRAEVREAVAKRANGCCEWCGRREPLEMDHFFGRARAESPETVWMLCRVCHRQKTDNWPSADLWRARFDAFRKAAGIPLVGPRGAPAQTGEGR